MPWTSQKPSSTSIENMGRNSLKVSVASTKRPNTSHLVPTEVRDYLSESARSKSVGNFSPPAEPTGLRDITPKNGGKRSSRSALLSTPSPTRENASRVSRGKDRIRKVTPRKVKVKRSIQEMFRKRDIKHNDGSVSRTVSKRSFNAGSTFAQRIKDSTAFSKTSPSKSLDPAMEAQHSTASERDGPSENDENMTLPTLEAGAFITEHPLPVQGLADTAKVINRIADRVTSMETSSPDRLRGVEIAEVRHEIFSLALERVLTRSQIGSTSCTRALSKSQRECRHSKEACTTGRVNRHTCKR